MHLFLFILKLCCLNISSLLFLTSTFPFYVNLFYVELMYRKLNSLFSMNKLGHALMATAGFLLKKLAHDYNLAVLVS